MVMMHHVQISSTFLSRLFHACGLLISVLEAVNSVNTIAADAVQYSSTSWLSSVYCCAEICSEFTTSCQRQYSSRLESVRQHAPL